MSKIDQLDFFYEDPNEDWVEIFPYGVTAGADQARSLMVFKDELEKRVLPVFLSPMETGMVISRFNATSGQPSPHHMIEKILETLGVQLKEVYFTDIRGAVQYVDLHFLGHEKLKVLTARADEALSFSMKTGVRFFCRPSYFKKCREAEGEMAHIELSLALNPEGDGRPQYLN